MSEALESRVMPAGTVTSTFVNGVVTLQGDADANDVTVTFKADHLVVAANGDTTLVGVAMTAGPVSGVVVEMREGADAVHFLGEVEGPDFQRIEVGSVRITTGDGSDQIEIDDILVRSSLTIDTGEGYDALTLGRLRAAAVLIETGDGNDSLMLDGLRAADVLIQTGDGNDSIQFGGVESSHPHQPFLVSGGFTLDTGAGRDVVDSFGKTAIHGTTLIRTAGGEDRVHLSSIGYDDVAYFRALRVETGTEMDAVILTGLQIGSLFIDTDAGVDHVQFGAEDSAIQVLGSLVVATGDGNDRMFVGGLTSAIVYPGNNLNEFRSRVLIDLGNGSDTLRIDSSEFSRGTELKLGAGKDLLQLGRFLGGLTFDGPLLLNAGGDSDTISAGIPGHSFTPGEEPLFHYGSTDFNGLVTITGGGSVRLDWYSDNATFSRGLRPNGARVVQHRINRLSLLTAPKITVVNRQPGMFQERTRRTFITNYITTRDDAGRVVVRPVVTPVDTGVTLNVRAIVSADRRFVTVALQFQKVTVDRVEQRTIVTPLGPQTIEVPIVTTITTRTQVVVPDGGTVLAGGLKQLTERLTDHQLFAAGANRQLLVTPRIIINGDDDPAGPLSVTLELRLIELIDRNILPFSNFIDGDL